jgi:hypothetical protein
MNKYILPLMLMIFATNTSQGQLLQKNIFPTLKDQALYDKVVSTYKTNTVLDYTMARDTLYKIIDAVNDTLECIYTGMKVYLTPGADPSVAAFNGIGGGINAEHGYPQSKGASVGIARSDMHHLYPTRVLANSSRMSSPLGEIPDNITTSWFRGTEILTSKPTININEYSEATATAFEPREKAKGNLARSIFYFYTMYSDLADAADPSFFNVQKATLCQWHYDDPVDNVEWKRTFGIAKYQENKPNPFVLDCSLVSRMYCNNIDQACEELVLVATSASDLPLESPAMIYPNPNNGYFWLTRIDKSTKVTIHDLQGKSLMGTDLTWGGDNWAHVNTHLSLGSGLYLCKISQAGKATQWVKIFIY